MKILARPKRWLKPFFTLSRTEQRGIIVLSILILMLLSLNQLLPYLIRNDDFNDPEFMEEVNQFLEQQGIINDSIQIADLQNRGKLDYELALHKLRPFPIDPNLATREDWLKIGLTEKQAQIILNYRSKGGIFKKREDFAKIYCISEGEYKVLMPYLLLPAPRKRKKQTQTLSSGDNKNQLSPVELNSADSAELVEKLRIKPWLAGRIIKYRNLLGGYYSTQQLLEVYGLDSNSYNPISDYLLVDTSSITKLNINTASFKRLLRHPYISYEMTKQIVNTRQKNGTYNNLEYLLNEELLTEEQFAKLKSYLIVR